MTDIERIKLINEKLVDRIYRIDCWAIENAKDMEEFPGLFIQELTEYGFTEEEAKAELQRCKRKESQFMLNQLQFKLNDLFG